MMVQSPYLMDEADAQLPKFYGSATNDVFGELAHANQKLGSSAKTNAGTLTHELLNFLFMYLRE